MPGPARIVVMSAADELGRGLSGAYWLRPIAVSLATAFAVSTILAVHGGKTFLVVFEHALVHAGTMTALGGLALPAIVRRLGGSPLAVRWGLITPALLALAVAGTGIACAFLTVTRLGDYEGPWGCFASDLYINAMLTMTLGVSLTIYKTQAARLAALTLELRTRELEHERSRKRAREPRLSSLESRLRPHFLFNTLNAISALVQDDPDRAERTVERLAALLRLPLAAAPRRLG